MENFNNLDIVRGIIRSSLFQEKSIGEKQIVLHNILETNQISRDELVFLINEFVKEQQIQEKEQETTNKLNESEIKSLENLDYLTFLTIIQHGQIEGQELLNLCNTSKKLYEYCNRSFQTMDAHDNMIGDPIPRYLFFLLLAKKGIYLFPGQDSREVYKQKTIGGTVWAFGDNYVGQIGVGKAEFGGIRYCSPVSTGKLKNIIQVSAGGSYSLCLDNRGYVWGFGSNTEMQLGLKFDIKEVYVPTLVPKLAKIVKISAGFRHSLALNNEGKVYGFGLNENYRLGFKNIALYSPRQIRSLKNIIEISAAYDYSLCLDREGSVWGFGNNNSGELGLINLENIVTPTLIPDLQNIVKISAGGGHSLCLDNQGRVWSFGDNTSGQLGLGNAKGIITPTIIPNLINIVQINAISNRSYCLDAEGRVWVFGFNASGMLGLGDKENRTIPVLLRTLNNIIQISAGSGHVLCLDVQGRVWSFGNGEDGELGLDSRDYKEIPTLIPKFNGVFQVSAGNGHSLVIKQ